MSTKFRLNINAGALAKSASLISNSVLLTANAYLIGSSFTNSFRDRKISRRNENLQTSAEIVSSIASLTKVVTDTLAKHKNASG